MRHRVILKETTEPYTDYFRLWLKTAVYKQVKPTKRGCLQSIYWTSVSYRPMF